MEIKIGEQRKFMMRWVNMIDRCDNPDNSMYHRYGGRGITVCSDWYDFFKYLKDLPSGYFHKAELDRTDNNGNYDPSNVRWATKQQNCANREVSRIIEFNGVSQCASGWARHIGINISSLIERMDNWSLEDALTMPKGTRLHNRWDGHIKAEKKPKKLLNLYEYNDKKYTMIQLSRLCGIPARLLRKRINERKWLVKRAVETKLPS